MAATTAKQAQYSNATNDAVQAFTETAVNRLPGVVVSQSIPPGTQVRQGETISVRIVSPSDVPLGSVAIPDFQVPVAIQNKSVGDIIELGSNPAVNDVISNPTDPVKQAAYVAAVNKQFGTSFGVGDVPALLTLQKSYSGTGF